MRTMICKLSPYRDGYTFYGALMICSHYVRGVLGLPTDQPLPLYIQIVLSDRRLTGRGSRRYNVGYTLGHPARFRGTRREYYTASLFGSFYWWVESFLKSRQPRVWLRITAATGRGEQ